MWGKNLYNYAEINVSECEKWMNEWNTENWTPYKDEI